MSSLTDRLIAPDMEPPEARNARRHVTALSLSKLSDGLVDPKLVLSWLLGSIGVPAAFIGMLVPIREAGALLPQVVLGGWLSRLRHRRWVWVTGSAVQGVAAIAIAMAATPCTALPVTQTHRRCRNRLSQPPSTTCGRSAPASRIGTSMPMNAAGTPIDPSNQLSTSFGSTRPSDSLLRLSAVTCRRALRASGGSMSGAIRRSVSDDIWFAAGLCDHPPI